MIALVPAILEGGVELHLADLSAKGGACRCDAQRTDGCLLEVQLRNHFRNTAFSHLYIHTRDHDFPGRNSLLGKPGGKGPPDPAPAADWASSSPANASQFVQVLMHDNAALRRVFVTTRDIADVKAWEDGRGKPRAYWRPLEQLRTRNEHGRGGSRDA